MEIMVSDGNRWDNGGGITVSGTLLFIYRPVLGAKINVLKLIKSLIVNKIINNA